MITKWKVANFKSIYKETELTFTPLTIFAGANSSGKSTLIQSILLIAQTIAHKVGTRSVVLNGSLTSLGQFDDLKSNIGKSNNILIEFSCQPLDVEDKFKQESKLIKSHRLSYISPKTTKLSQISCGIEFNADTSSKEKELLQLQPRLSKSTISCNFLKENNEAIKYYLKTEYLKDNEDKKATDDGLSPVSEEYNRVIKALSYKIMLDNYSKSEFKENYKSALPIGCIMQHFLPMYVLYAVDPIKEYANNIALVLQGKDFHLSNKYLHKTYLTPEVISLLLEIFDIDKITKNERRKDLLFGEGALNIPILEWYNRLRSFSYMAFHRIRDTFSKRDDLYNLVYDTIKKASLKDNPMPYEIIESILPRRIAEATRYLNVYFTSSLNYLGPLRDTPKPLYPISPTTDPLDVGLRGENTASVFELNKNRTINYIPSYRFKSPTIDHELVKVSLGEAVIDWLKYLCIATSLETCDKGKLGFELKVETIKSSIFHDLTHVGVGVSQVLPILVMCLLADNDSTLVIEQPELHLHPKVQCLLADFFLSISLSKKQCIIETHSEYLIDRLRFRIAAAPIEENFNNQTKIYFVEKKEHQSTFREVIINEYGAITDWPDGFFDQSHQLAEDIIISATKKRTERKKRDE